MPAQKFFVFCSCQLDFIFNGNEGRTSPIQAWAKALTGPTSLPGKYPQLMNPPGSETGPGQLVTWGKSIVCSVDAFDFKFQWTTNSSKHIPFDWTGPGQFVPLTTRNE
jgi:hypothetical protein